MSKSEVVDYIKESFDLKNQGHYKPAIEMLYKVLTYEPDNLEILAQLAHLYFLLQNFQRSKYYIEKVLEHNPEHVDCLILQKEIYLAEDKLPHALDVSEKIFKIQPSDENLAAKIRLLSDTNKFSEIEDLSNFDSPLGVETLYELARAFLKYGQLDKAKNLLESAEQNTSQCQKVLLLLGKIYYESKNFKNAQNIFASLLKSQPSAEVYNYLGLLKLNENDCEKAVKFFSRACKSDPQISEYYYNLASAYFLNGWRKEALSALNNSLCIEPENLNYHYFLAYLYYQNKNYEKAKNEVEYILKIDCEHEEANILKALIAGKNDDLLGAKNQLEQIVKISSDNDFAISSLGKIYFDLARFDLAEEMAQKALELKPFSLSYKTDLIEIEFNLKNYDKAKCLTEELIDSNPKYFPGYSLLAQICYETKDFEKLYDVAQSLIDLNSSSAEGYYYNAVSLFAQGDTLFAIESLKKSISLDLNNAKLYMKMSEFYQDLNDLKQAYEWAKEACEIDDRSYQNKWMCAKIAASLKNEDEAIKYYSQSYRLSLTDKDLIEEYAHYLVSIGKKKQADSILATLVKN